MSYEHDPDYLKTMESYLAGQWSEAAEGFDKLDRNHPDTAYLKLLRGNVAYSMGQLGGSVQHYRDAVQVDPSYGIAWYKLGVCLFRMGRLSEAEEAFSEVLARPGQSHAMARYFIGLISVFLGNDIKAAAAFTQFRAESPESKIANFYLAQLRVRDGQFAEALELLQDLEADSPGFGELHYWMGAAHLGAHDTTEAIRSFTKALDVNPDDERAKMKLSLLTEVQWP